MKKAAPIQSRFEAVLLDWRRLFARVPNVTVSLLTSFICFIFGLIGIATSGKYFLGGLAISVFGILRGAYCMKVFLLRRESKRVEHEKRLLREAHLEARKERKLDDKLEKNKLLDEKHKAAELGKQALAREQDEERTKSLRQQLDLREREAKNDFEVKQILKLSDSELLTETVAAFETLGLFPKSEGAGVENGFVLNSTKSTERSVCLCVPIVRKADCEDVNLIAKMRTEAHATSAYLVSIAGFSEESVVLSAKLSVSLVEAHLLANWKTRTDLKGDNLY